MLLRYARFFFFGLIVVFMEKTQMILMIFMYVNMAFTMGTLAYLPEGRNRKWKATLNEVFLIIMGYH